MHFSNLEEIATKQRFLTASQEQGRQRQSLGLVKDRRSDSPPKLFSWFPKRLSSSG